ncbi:MAG: SpoIVB peptidase [Clostridia bacterium]|nr:SpoIVB peptidase [Clostridia bacterium]
MKKGLTSLVLFILMFCFSFSVVMPLQEVLSLEDGFLSSYEDVESSNQNNKFGFFIKSNLEEKEKIVGGQKNKQNEVIFKLFGFIPIKKVSVVMAGDEDFYVGGVPVGLTICSEGAIVVSNDNDDVVLKEGDIITHINGKPVEGLDNIQDLLQDGESVEETEIEFLRKNKPIKALVKSVRDDDTGKLRLGLWVKDDISGVGTLTFVNKKTHRYGALGHPIVEGSGGNVVPVANGKIYECNLIGINKGKRNNPGELRCVFKSNSNSKGSIESNTKFGISGVLNDTTDLVDENLTAKLGGRLGVKMGKAKIVSSISGIREEYDIEIIKTNYQKSANDKSIVFRVKDKRLLDMTGGIVQGMSGSPIMQDGKIVGAVTHVFLNDPTKGYGVYVDWMLN